MGGHAPERDGEEAHRAADVHRVAEDVEREALDALVHEDAEVVAEEGAGNAECKRGGDHEELAETKQRCGDIDVERFREEWDRGLVEECALIPVYVVMGSGTER